MPIGVLLSDQLQRRSLDPDAPMFQSESFDGIRDTSLALRNVNANRNR
jgi:hypothetical protein